MSRISLYAVLLLGAVVRLESMGRLAKSPSTVAADFSMASYANIHLNAINRIDPHFFRDCRQSQQFLLKRIDRAKYFLGLLDGGEVLSPATDFFDAETVALNVYTVVSHDLTFEQRFAKILLCLRTFPHDGNGYGDECEKGFVCPARPLLTPTTSPQEMYNVFCLSQSVAQVLLEGIARRSPTPPPSADRSPAGHSEPPSPAAEEEAEEDVEDKPAAAAVLTVRRSGTRPFLDEDLTGE